MPKYEYICELCGNHFEEVVRKFEPKDTCQECGGKLRQVYGFKDIYKGPGFYTTEARGITGKKRRPKVKVGSVSDLPPEERGKHSN